MKKFTKLFLSCAVATALSATMGVAAMADGEPAAGTVVNITGDVTGKVTITEAGAATVAATVSELAIAGNPTLASNSQVTFLVFKGTTAPDVAGKNVVGIDQGASIQPENAGLKTTKTGADDAAVAVPSEGQDTYTVKVGYTPEGGTFTTKTGTFKLGTATGVEIVLGDVTGDDVADSLDAVKILNLDAGKKTSADIANAGKAITIVDAGELTLINSSTKLGDVTDDGAADSLDAVKILNLDAGKKAPADIVNAGKTVSATVAE